MDDTTPDIGAHPTSDLEEIRALILQANPDLVPELVGGESVADLMASVAPAKQAYANLADRLTPPSVPIAQVPAGGHQPLVIDIAAVPTAEKIRRGVAQFRSTTKE